MKITYTLTDEDLQKYTTTDFVNKNKIAPKTLIFIGSFILIIILLIAIIAKDYSYVVSIALFFMILYFILQSPKFFKKKYLKALNTDEERIVEIGDKDLMVINSTRSTSYKFSEIKEVNFVNEYFVFVKFNPGDSLIIPKTAFSNNEEIIDFINKIKTKARIL